MSEGEEVMRSVLEQKVIAAAGEWVDAIVVVCNGHGKVMPEENHTIAVKHDAFCAAVRAMQKRIERLEGERR
jgi:hypothetical protein